MAINKLTLDLIRLKRMAYFATKFQLRTLDHNIDIAGESRIFSLLHTTHEFCW